MLLFWTFCHLKAVLFATFKHIKIKILRHWIKTTFSRWLPNHLQQIWQEDEDVGAFPDVVDVDARKKLVQESGKQRNTFLRSHFWNLCLPTWWDRRRPTAVRRRTAAANKTPLEGLRFKSQRWEGLSNQLLVLGKIQYWNLKSHFAQHLGAN